MKEKQLLEWIPGCFSQGQDVIVGPGDDCAVIDFHLEKYYLMAVDQVIAETHYFSDSTSPAQIARKLLNRNISDIAAMGGVPAHALLSMSITPEKPKSWFDTFFTQMAQEADKWNISICGGDIASTEDGKDTFSLSITGWVEKKSLCLRKGAQSNDILFATGCFGNSLESGHHIDFIPRLKEARFLAAAFTNTMIDVSDGLLIDAARIAENSNIGLMLNTHIIPCRQNASLEAALTDGEDYELLFAVSPLKARALLDQWSFANTKLTAIGTFSQDIKKGAVIDSNANILYDNCFCEFRKSGFDHFAETQNT